MPDPATTQANLSVHCGGTPPDLAGWVRGEPAEPAQTHG